MVYLYFRKLSFSSLFDDSIQCVSNTGHVLLSLISMLKLGTTTYVHCKSINIVKKLKKNSFKCEICQKKANLKTTLISRYHSKPEFSTYGSEKKIDLICEN